MAIWCIQRNLDVISEGDKEDMLLHYASFGKVTFHERYPEGACRINVEADIEPIAEDGDIVKLGECTEYSCELISVVGHSLDLYQAGQDGVAYSDVITLQGGGTKTIGSDSLPAGLTSSILGDELTISGTPTVSGAGLDMIVTIENCDTDDYVYQDTIDIA